MKKYARSSGNVVVELFETDGDITTMFHPDIVWRDVTDIVGIAEGWEDDGVTFSAPVGPTLADTKKVLVESVDSKVSAIYNKYIRFRDEYEKREAAARAFVAANYIGDAGPWVMGFATPAGKTPTQAADTIVAQADALRAALELLGGLRMRKYEIAFATDSTTAQTIYDNIIAEVEFIAEGLG